MTDRIVKTTDFIIPANLWPGDAQEMRTQLVQWLSEQGLSPEIDLGDETAVPTVSALQLIVAVTRRISAPPIAIGKNAYAALARLAEPQQMEWQAQ